METIGNNGFYGCSNLSDISCYAAVPPSVADDAFKGIAEGAVLHVLSSSVPLYAEAMAWRDFTILPLTEEVRTLEVSLPGDGVDGRYKNMTLELVNVQSGQRQRYVISDRLAYTFNGLLKNTEYNVYVKNDKGAVLGQIDGIAVVDEDVCVAFGELLQPHDVALKVVRPDGTDVTSQVQATWMDAENRFLQQGSKIVGLLAGTEVTCRISLPQELGLSCRLPGDTVYKVKESGNELCVSLKALDVATVKGRVKDASTGKALPDVVVSVSQRLNGLYSKAFTVKTGDEGNFSVQVYDAPSTVVLSASGYLNMTLEKDYLESLSDLGDLALEPITGTTIATGYTYTPSVAEGEEAIMENWYSDYENVSYSIYNMTTGKEVTQFSVQYPAIVLLEEVAEGDRLRLTASSRVGAFLPVDVETVVGADNRAEVTVPIVELGGIRAAFTFTENTSVVGLLYDIRGQLVKKYDYVNAVLSITGIADGEYTLVTMSNSSLFNSILNLAQFEASGLKEGSDYVQDKVKVESGVIAVVTNDAVPVLDESKLYYTGENTSFSVNKTSIVAGNYLTLKAQMDFRSEYISQVSDVCLVVDFPTSCSFVENSVMAGSKVVGYTIDGNRLTVPLSHYGDQVRFCVIPTDGGDYAPNAFARFMIGGKEVLQPIGSANYTVRDLSIMVPSTVAKTSVPVSGTAFGKSDVQVFDNGILIGETTALANGMWSIVCELYSPENLTTHSICAKVTTKEGISMETERHTLKYDEGAIQVSSVTMVNTAHGATSLEPVEYVTKFDFESPTTKEQTYWYWPQYPDFTFMVDFTRNDTSLISGVSLHVKTSSGSIVRIPAFYDEKKAKWVAMKKFDSNSLPLNLSVTFDYMDYDMCDSLHCLRALEGGFGLAPTVSNYAKVNENLYVCTMSSYDGSLSLNCVYARAGKDGKRELVGKAESMGFEKVLDYGDWKYYSSSFNASQQVKETADSAFVFAYFLPEDKDGYDEYVAIMEGKPLIEPFIAGFDPGADQIAPSTDRLNQWRDGMIQGAIDEANRKLKCADDVTNIQLHSAVKSLRQCVGFSLGSFMAHSMNLTISTASKPGSVGEAAQSAWGAIDGALGFGAEMQNLSAAGRAYLKQIHDAPDCGDGGGDNGDGSGESGSSDAGYVMDPSGFVYEGVSSNRLEGVTATCYYKEMVEDMYGDLHENVVLWDAAEYAQENPLFTDENGMYRWDVPQGLWQVKFEKEGYETTYSEWLPVPPPQLEVNICMTQNRQPEVKSVHAYEGGIEVEFDKYMMTDGLTMDNVFVSKAGEEVSGTLVLLDEEQACEGNPVTYASKVRFIPQSPFLATDEVLLTVSRKVKSYAGIQMEADFTQSFGIEREVKSIVVDSLVKVPYGGDKAIVVSVLPYDAAIGEALAVKSSSMVATVSEDTLTLDGNGQASFVIHGELPGTSVITFTLAEAKAVASSIVQVSTDMVPQVAKPIASRASGTEVYRNTDIELSCETADAAIYYTTDGSCPCDENGTRQFYVKPIRVSDAMTIKAVAEKEGLEASEMASFSYTIKTAKTGLDLHAGWNWISHNVETAVPLKSLPNEAVCVRGRDAEAVKDESGGFVGSLSGLEPQASYKLQASGRVRQVLEGYAFNPSTTFSLQEGWNWLGYPLGQVMSLPEAFALAEPTEEDYIVGQDGFAQYSSGAWTGTLQTLVPGKGYLYYSQDAKSFVYNTVVASKARSLYAKGMENLSPWTVDKYRYPDVMCVIADVFDGAVKAGADKYTVGAFCGSECRGVGQFVDGKLMLSVYGLAGDKVTFKAVDNASGQAYAVKEEAEFAEILLGSLSVPSALHIGEKESGIASTKVGWRIWPGIVSDELHVACPGGVADKVSLTDVYGHTVLVEKEVSPMRGVKVSHLPDGVYVVTVMAGNDVCHKKIVKAGR